MIELIHHAIATQHHQVEPRQKTLDINDYKPEVSSVLKSPCASTYKTPRLLPYFLVAALTPTSEPKTIEWSPPSTRGKSLAVIFSTSAASSVHAFVIGFK